MTSPTAKMCGCLGAEVGVHRDAPASVGFDAGGCQIQLVDVALPADGVEQRVAGDLLLAFQVRHHAAVGRFFHARHFFVEPHGHAAVAQVIGERLDHFRIGEFQQARPFFHQDHAHAQRRRTCRCIRRR